MIVTMMMAVIVFPGTKRNIYKPRLTTLHRNKHTGIRTDCKKKTRMAGLKALTIDEAGKNDHFEMVAVVTVTRDNM